MIRKEMKVEVMLDIFSGRPNPRWELSEEQIEELKMKLDALPAGTKKKPPVLGYRGIRVLNVSRIEGLPERIKAYNGVLAINERKETDYYEDVNNIEDWLLNQARKEGYDEAINQFRKYGRDK